MSIHPTAIIEPTARLGENVSVGAYSLIGPHVEIGDGTQIGPHVVIDGHTRIGRENQIYQFASIGGAPQDKKYADEPTHLEIGDRNVIREGCTINLGTVQDEGITRIGDDNWIMAYVHVAHDCRVGNKTILANNVALAGHVSVDDHAILGGFTLVHQFCAIGKHAFTAMGSGVGKDVPPYMRISGNPASVHGLNTEGLKRRGFSSETIRAFKRGYKTLYRSGLTLEQAIAELRDMAEEVGELAELVRFLEQQTRGIVR